MKYDLKVEDANTKTGEETKNDLFSHLFLC